MNPDTSQLFAHLILFVEDSHPLLSREHDSAVRLIFDETLRVIDCELIAFASVDDHVHLLIRWSPDLSVEDHIRELHDRTREWLHKDDESEDFEWDEDFFWLNCSPWDVDEVTEYIERQRELHESETLEEELERIRTEESPSLPVYRERYWNN